MDRVDPDQITVHKWLDPECTAFRKYHSVSAAEGRMDGYYRMLLSNVHISNIQTTYIATQSVSVTIRFFLENADLL